MDKMKGPKLMAKLKIKAAMTVGAQLLNLFQSKSTAASYDKVFRMVAMGNFTFSKMNSAAINKTFMGFSKLQMSAMMMMNKDMEQDGDMMMMNPPMVSSLMFNGMGNMVTSSDNYFSMLSYGSFATQNSMMTPSTTSPNALSESDPMMTT